MPTKKEILKVVANAYPGSEIFPRSLSEARLHQSGDGLADFIRIELDEVMRGEPDDRLADVCVNALEVALRDIQCVIDALLELEV